MAIVWGLMLGDRRVATLATARPRRNRIIRSARRTRPRRAPRIIGPVRRRLIHLPVRTPRRATIGPRVTIRGAGD